MYTQNTPIHVSLWHRGFWLLAIANMLLSMSVYMLVPVMPLWLMARFGMSPLSVGVAMGVYGVGVFLLGGFCSYLIQRYRRNRVCIWSVIGMMVCLALFWVVAEVVPCREPWMVYVLRLGVGALFGLADMVLASTLIIDQCESFQRTEANYAASWFRRFALSLGPVLSIFCYHVYGFNRVLLLSGITAFVSIVLIRIVKFPFKAPDDTMTVVSLDRFFLPRAFPLFVNLLMVSTLFGMIVSMEWTEHFYVMMMAGFLLALLAQKFMFVNAELRSETVTGLFCLAVAGTCVDADTYHSHGPLCESGVCRIRRGTDRVALPVVLHQAERPLPAGNLSEHLLPVLGTGHVAGTVRGLRTSVAPAAPSAARRTGHRRRGAPGLPSLYT